MTYRFIHDVAIALVTMAPLAVIVIGLLKLVIWAIKHKGLIVTINEVEAEKFDIPSKEHNNGQDANV